MRKSKKLREKEPVPPVKAKQPGKKPKPKLPKMPK